MKKTFLTVVLLTIGLSFSLAQAQFALGIKAGPNFANLNFDESPGVNYKARTGFHGGAFALVKLTKFGIQPEVLFSQQGSKVTFNSQELESNFTYVNIPVMLKFYLVGGLNLQAGPQIGFVTSAKQDFFDDVTQTLVKGEDIKDQLNGVDFSAALGAGWDLPFGLTIDARYNLGLSNISKNDSSEEAKNQVFQLSLGFKLIKLGK